MFSKKHMNNLFNKHKLLIILIFINFAAYHIWFFNFDILAAGDWGQRYIETSKMYFSVLTVWSPIYYGFVDMMPSLYPTLLMEGLMAFLNLSHPLTMRLIWMWPVILFPLFGSYFLIKKFTKSDISAFVGSLVFSFNTYFIMGRTGHLTVMASFGMAPLIILFFIKSLESRKIYYGVLTGLLCFIASAYELRSLNIIAGVLFLYFIYHFLIIEKLRFKKTLQTIPVAVLPFIITGVLNLYWLLGYLKLGPTAFSEILQRSLFGSGFMNIVRSMTLFHPFWTGSKYYSFVVQPIPFYFFLVPVFAILGIMFNRRNKIVLFFSIISLLGIILTKQSAEPFPHLYTWLYNHMPGFSVYRESSKFYFLIALGYSILIAFFIDWLWKTYTDKRWKKYIKYCLTFIIVLLFVWNTKPIITGEIEMLFVPRKAPQDYLIVKNFIMKQPEYFRTLWSPQISKWSFYNNDHPYIGGDVYVKQSIFKDLIGKEYTTKNYIFQHEFAGKFLDMSSVKYVFVPQRDRFYKNDDDLFFWLPKDRKYFIDALDNAGYLTKIDIGTQEIVAYENKEYRPHIYLTYEKETIHADIPYEKVDYKPINPSQYQISLKNISKSFYTNFSEAYHPDWKVRIGKMEWLKALTNDKYFLSDQNHIKNDAELNSFFIDPGVLCKTDNACLKNADGSYNINFTIYFRPQSYIYLGSVISGMTLITIIGYLLIILILKSSRI